jgi:hypothetical protein
MNFSLGVSGVFFRYKIWKQWIWRYF